MQAYSMLDRGSLKRRRLLGWGLATPLLAAAGARAQPPGTVRRIGVLLGTSRKRQNIERLLVPFDLALRELGHAEGRNLLIEWREAHGRIDRLAPLAAELVARKVEVIVAGTGDAAVAAARATDVIPVIFVASGDPVGAGLVKSLARPGGNVTGFANLGEAVTRKQLELLRELLPRLGKLAVIHSPGHGADRIQFAAMREASAALGLAVALHGVLSEADLDGAFSAIERERPDALQVFLTVTTYLHRRRIAELAAATRIPAVYGYVEYVQAGGLISYGFSYADNWRRTASYVDRILKGAKPGELPVQQPQTLELAVNLSAAKALGLSIPPSVLLRANEVLE
jgi:putative tryptophan/tyrosine transport system substrate-binding protein